MPFNISKLFITISFWLSRAERLGSSIFLLITSSSERDIASLLLWQAITYSRPADLRGKGLQLINMRKSFEREGNSLNKFVAFKCILHEGISGIRPIAQRWSLSWVLISYWTICIARSRYRCWVEIVAKLRGCIKSPAIICGCWIKEYIFDVII